MRLAVVVLLLLAAPAQAAAAPKDTEWRKLLAEQGVERRSDAFSLKPIALRRRSVVVRVRARERVSFPDGLYGATAWKWAGGAWRRVDSADFRPTVVTELSPGERARVALQLVKAHRAVRVLVPTTPDRAGRWVDVK